MTRVVLIGGPFDRSHPDLLRQPPLILVGGVPYERLDDPDTGESLDGYVARSEVRG